jgi:hypothetical protein
MPSTSRLTFFGLALFLLALPLAVGKPGLPAGLKADEAAYYMMASSLAADGDLRLDVADTERVFAEFPYRPVNNLIVMSPDGWRSVYYGKPFVYSLFAAPLVALFGANGMLFLNMALTVAMIALGARFLRRYNPEPTALLFSAAFFLASTGFAYVFWLQPEVFNMFAVTLALYCGWPTRERLPGANGLEDGEQGRAFSGLSGFSGFSWLSGLSEHPPLGRLLVSGGALALAAFSKPMVLALLLPLMGAQLWPQSDEARRRRWLGVGALMVGLAGVLLGIAALHALWTGRPTPYLGVARQGVTLCEPGQLPPAVLRSDGTALSETDTHLVASADTSAATMVIEPEVIEPEASEGAAPGSARTGSATGNAFSWLLRVPEMHWLKLTENVRYFLWGRHTGLLLYFPFCALAVLFFVLHATRSLARWLLLASLVVVAGYFLIWIDWNWQGGGGFVGNRYFVNVVPAFLFLVGPIRPRWTLVATFGLAGLLVGPIVLTPFSNVVPEPTLQAHTRNWPLRLFPLEIALRNVPGYYTLDEGGMRIVVRRDRAVPRGDSLWISGATATEVLLLASEPIDDLQLLVRTPAGGRVRLRVDGDAENLDLRADETRRIALEPKRPVRRRSPNNGIWSVYRLVVETSHGTLTPWTRPLPSESCTAWGSNESVEETFFLGPSARLEQDLYRALWSQVATPATVVAGTTFSLRTPVRNASGADWPSSGSASVKLAHRWRDATGNVVGPGAARTRLSHDLASGRGLSVDQIIAAPREPGRYTLELDLVYEHIAWFGERDPRNIHRAEIEVVGPAETPAETAAD